MNTIEIQVEHGDTWRKVSSVQYDKDREKNWRIGDTTYYSKAGAVRAAFQHRTAWEDSHQFTGRKMRVAELVVEWNRRYYQVITRMGI